MIYNFFATCPKGLELLLADELQQLGAKTAREKLAGVEFTGSIEAAYRACLWSRLANRILLKLSSAPAKDADELYAAVKQINWFEHFDVTDSFAVHCTASSSTITHTLFAAQKTKDAIVDQFRDRFGDRPNVDKEQPAVSVYVHLQRDIAAIYLDLSGKSLHRRGYRLDTGAAPLKENLAAAILIRSGWPAIAKACGTLMDPMCGSGTLLIEGAQIAADIAPGLDRDYFGFLGWKHHQKNLWERLVLEADKRRAAGLSKLPAIIGYDQDAAAIKVAFANIERAGMLGKIHVEKRDLKDFSPHAAAKPGLVVTNPPYGERLGEIETLQPLYTELGERLKGAFENWQAGVFTGNPDLGKQMGLRAKKFYTLYNGPILCKLLIFNIEPHYFVDRSESAENARRIKAAQKTVGTDIHAQLQMFINRLQKNFKHLKKQMKRSAASVYTIYDADLPDYAFRIEMHEDAVHVYEYLPKNIDPAKVLRRRQEMLSVLPDALGLNANQVFFKGWDDADRNE